MWENLYKMPKGVETRWTSHENPTGAKGGACRDNDGRKRNACICPLKAGETAVLADFQGTSGTVRRIWATISNRTPAMLRGLRLDITWDAAATPAVSVPFGDFFCHSLGRVSVFENAFFSSPEGRSFNCCIPMPFRSGVRITVTNETADDQPMFFYDINVTLGDRHPRNVLYFHSHWRRENPTRLGEDYAALPLVRGRGRFLGVNFGVIVDTAKYFTSWWGEGEVKMYLDGDSTYPTLCGTGTEDYIGTGWGLGQYANHFQGCTIADNKKSQFAFYRLHGPDPVWFNKEIRVTMQQIGLWTPDSIKPLHQSGIQLRRGDTPVDTAFALETKYGFFEREDDWSSCAWFYLDSPENKLPGLQPLGERVADLDATPAVEQPPGQPLLAP